MQGATHANAFRYPTHTNLHAHGKVDRVLRELLSEMDVKLTGIGSDRACAGVWMYGGVPDIGQTTVSYQGYGDNIFLDVSHCHNFRLARSASSVNICLDIDGRLRRFNRCRAPYMQCTSVLVQYMRG